MTTQAAPDFNAELARQTKATETAQALADDHERTVKAQRAEIEGLMEEWRVCRNTLAASGRSYAEILEKALYWEAQYKRAFDDSVEQRLRAQWAEQDRDKLADTLADSQAANAILRDRLRWRAWLRRLVWR